MVSKILEVDTKRTTTAIAKEVLVTVLSKFTYLKQNKDTVNNILK